MDSSICAEVLKIWLRVSLTLMPLIFNDIRKNRLANCPLCGPFILCALIFYMVGVCCLDSHFVRVV